MAVQQELWLPAIEENLFKGMELIRTVSADDIAFINGSKIHVPNAGAPMGVTRGNSTYPVTASERTDTDTEYSLTNFEIGPARLGWADGLQLSYNKVQSITNDFMGNMNERIKDYILSQWYKYAAGTIVSTTGVSTTLNWLGGSATGALKHILGADVRSAAKILDYQKFPTTDRFLLLDPDMFWQLLGDMAYNTERLEVVAGLSATIDTIYGFTVIQLPYIAAVSANSGTSNPIVPGADGAFSFAAANRPVGLAFHKSAVSHALTAPQMFVNNKAAGWFGDLMEASVYGGGKYRRTNGEGVVAIRGTSA